VASKPGYPSFSSDDSFINKRAPTNWYCLSIKAITDPEPEFGGLAALALLTPDHLKSAELELAPRRFYWTTFRGNLLRFA
jgi:hypothetical protein